MDWGKILCNNMTNKGLTSKTYKQLIQLNSKTNQPNQKMGRRSKQTFLPRRHTEMAKWHMTRCLPLLIIKEMQIKSLMKYQLTHVRMAIIKMSTSNKCWQGWREKGAVGGNVNWCKSVQFSHSEEEKLKFYITSFSFCLCNSACPLQSLDYVGHIVSESGDLQYLELEFISLTLVLLFIIAHPLQTCLIRPVQTRHLPPHFHCCSHMCKTP